MSLKDLEIKGSYISQGDNNIVNAFLMPALRESNLYKRSVGFFSSSSLKLTAEGMIAIAKKKGNIQLIASPKLSEDDIDAIKYGYEKRELVIKDAFSRNFIEEIDNFDDLELKLLIELVSNNILDIKIAVTDTIGVYHDKLGILEDADGNIIVFYGSANASYNAYHNNYEKIRIVKNWIDGQKESVNDELNEFDSMWSGTNKYVKVYDYTETAKNNLLQIIEFRKSNNSLNKPIVLREYQKEAIDAWVANDYKGFYVMATGTGKTWTALFSAKKLLEKHDAIIVICAPYKHLIKQWYYDVKNIFSEAHIIIVSSENPNWHKEIKDEIIGKKYNIKNQIIIISTIASFNTDRFLNSMKGSKDDKLLIVDEAHRFNDRSEKLKETYKYMLGLSATPFSGVNANKGKELMAFFGGQVYNLPIEIALKKGFLIPYYYYPIYVYSTEEEEEKFSVITNKIASCFKDNKCINEELLIKSLRNRLRVISMSSEKQEKIDEIIDNINEKDHIIVYCGDGKLFDNETGDEVRHIQSIKKALTKHSYKASQFTANENMEERMQLIDTFNKGEITALAAIRCLDEGINIPSIKSALILSSNDNYREFVQRRGRILRKYKNKEYACIYDVIVLPSENMQAWIKIELRRFLEYARLSLNWDSLREELETILLQYSLLLNDIDVYDYEDMEDVQDE